MHADEEYRQAVIETCSTVIGMNLAGVSQFCRVNAAKAQKKYDDETADITAAALYAGNQVAFEVIAKFVDELDAANYASLAKILDERKKSGDGN